MMTQLDHPVVTAYLGRLRAVASAQLPAHDAADLVADIEEHLANALAGSDGSEASVRNVVERLGTPEEVVGAAGGRVVTPPPPPAQAPPQRNQRERLAVGLLVASVVVVFTLVGAWLNPFLLIPGLVLTWMSTVFRLSDKLLATLAYAGVGPLTILILGGLTFRTQECTGVTNPDGTFTQSCSGGGDGLFGVGGEATIVLIGGLTLTLWTYTAIRLWRRANARP